MMSYNTKKIMSLCFSKLFKRMIAGVLCVVIGFSVFSYSVFTSNVDYSSLTVNEYLAKIFTNNNYYGYYNNDGETSNQVSAYINDFFLNVEKRSKARIITNEFRDASDYKTTRAIYNFLTFNPSDVAEEQMKLEDYYTAVLLSIVDTAMAEDNFLDDLNCQQNKIFISLSKSATDLFEATAEYGTHTLETITIESLDEDLMKKLSQIFEVDPECQELWEMTGDKIGFISDTLSAVENVNDAIKNISNFSQLANTTADIKAVLHSIYLNCPDTDNAVMKSAAKNVYEYASGELTKEVLSVCEVVNAGFKYTVTQLLDIAWKELVKGFLGPLATGVFIGQAVGKSIAQFCFATDAVHEQLCAVNALVEIEDVVLNAVNSLKNTYISNPSMANSNNFIASLHILMNVYDLGNEYVGDFITTAYTKGAVNNILYENSAEYKEWQDLISNQKQINKNIESALYISAYASGYQIDAPNAYSDCFYPGVLEPIRIDYEYIVNADNKSVTVTAYKEGSSVNAVVPETINGYLVTGIGENTFKQLNVKTVVISDTVTTIQNNAFYGCTELTSVNIPNSVISIGENAFYDCDSLQSIVIPNSVRSIGASVFLNCNNLSSVTLGNRIESIPGYAFNECYKLASISIPDSVKSIGNYAFQRCYSLSSVSIGKGVESIGGRAFSDCNALKSITIPNNVNNLGEHAFYDCDNLDSAVIGDKVNSIGKYTFYNCESLNSVKISNAVEDIGYGAFYNCDALKSITIPDSVKRLGEYAFCNCDNLASVILGENVSGIGKSAFMNCSSLVSFVIPNSVEKIGYAAFENCTNLKNIDFGSGIKEIEDAAFMDCTSLENAILPDSVIKIGDINVDGFPLDIPGMYPSASGVFWSCTSLKKVKIPNGITVIDDYIFRDCINLNDVELPESVEYIGMKAFYGCKSLTEIRIPKSVNEIDWAAFGDCYNLESITVDDNNPKYTSYWNCLIEIDTKTLLYGCSDSVIPSDGSVEEIDYLAFKGKKNLNKILIPDGVTYIDGEAFMDCINLNSIVLPGSLGAINASAFLDCENLQKVYYSGTRSMFDDLRIYSHNDELLNAEWVFIEDFDGDNQIDKYDEMVFNRLAKDIPYLEVGDVNNDSVTDIRDLVRIKKFVSGTADNPEMDFDGDSLNSATDVAFITRFILFFDRYNAL